MTIAPIFTTTPSSVIINAGRGRPISDETWALRQRVISVLRSKHGDTYTAQEVARATKQSMRKVRDQLMWLEKHGAIFRFNPNTVATITTKWKNIEVIDLKCSYMGRDWLQGIPTRKPTPKAQQLEMSV